MSGSFISKEMVERVESFHGHMCPGLAIGIRASEIALREIGPHAEDEEIVAVVETDMCGVDAVQFLTGCTFGKGNLIHKDYGKVAFSFYRRSDGKGIRIVARPTIRNLDPEREALLSALQGREPTTEERERLRELHGALSERILQAPLELLFEIKEAPPEIPKPARIHRTLVCEACGEGAMATRTRLLEDRVLCLPCYEAACRGTCHAPMAGRDAEPSAGTSVEGN